MMSSFNQLLCLLFSLIYGYFIQYIVVLNYKFIDKFNVCYKIIITVLIINNISLLYILMLYKLNKGIIHIYFLLFLIIGFFIKYVNKRKQL